MPSLQRQRAGFTLLELLIVIFIISLISSGFVRLMTGFGGAAQSLEDETRRLHRLLTLTAQEAILQGDEIGLQIGTDAYYFVVPAKNTSWKTLEGDELLKHHQLPQGWHLELRQDGEVIPPVAPIKNNSEEDEKQPDPYIIFYDSGEMTAFQLRIYAADHPRPSIIDAKENGEIDIYFQEPEQ